jgi:NAD-dependent SIR2 family protein deacetylase
MSENAFERIRRAQAQTCLDFMECMQAEQTGAEAPPTRTGRTTSQKLKAGDEAVIQAPQDTEASPENVDLVDETIERACDLLKEAKKSGGSLIILTGAGMSVASGVPVFRNSNGSMSKDFLNFLSCYNQKREKQNLPLVDDWFDFSVAEMFQKETEVEAWHYWRWRILRARVKPATDYKLLQRISKYFNGRTFVMTSNCDELHLKAGANRNQVCEIHGSLGMLQCSGACCHDLYPVNETVLEKLKDEKDPNWVPRCPKCKNHCLRPNVMIFQDDMLVYDLINEQEKNYFDFKLNAESNFAVLEIGAGTVVPSIRFQAESLGTRGKGMIRINPSPEECLNCAVDDSKYFGLISKGAPALEKICKGLGV